jgi:hypothetical protein
MLLEGFAEKEPVMDRSSRQPGSTGDGVENLPGDPGVGGLLSDPLTPSRPHKAPDPAAGPPSPDPEPPRHHGDWMPPRKASSRWSATSRLASITWRRSRNGMPKALFREGDGITLEDLRSI